MKRRGILGALIGCAVASGQVMQPAIVSDGDLIVRKVKPKNGECPVCGTVADKYPARQELKNCHGPSDILPTSGDSNVLVCDPVYISGERVVRCAFCNCAFFQDGEKP